MADRHHSLDSDPGALTVTTPLIERAVNQLFLRGIVLVIEHPNMLRVWIPLMVERMLHDGEVTSLTTPKRANAGRVAFAIESSFLDNHHVPLIAVEILREARRLPRILQIVLDLETPNVLLLWQRMLRWLRRYLPKDAVGTVASLIYLFIGGGVLAAAFAILVLIEKVFGAFTSA